MHLRDNRFTKITFLMIVALTIAGCGGSLLTYKGNKVTQRDLMVLLKDGNQQGVWKTNELAITYQYQMTPETLNFTGNTKLVGGFALGFRRITRLSVYLLFLDNQGIVLDNVLIYSLGSHHATDGIPMDFENTIPIPAGARTISFAYEGVLDGVNDIGFSPFKR
ncbi:MAG: hypothetical protein HY881_12855 [Deltaproteobacteria bacterium]|nr:hypothetical protein [Deltaproteobacteria bacterium]